MASVILKLAEDKFVEWSTVVDAPTTSVMDLGELKEFLQELHARNEGLMQETNPKIKAMKQEIVRLQVQKRLDRVLQTGTSSLIPDDSLAGYIETNRAGPQESCLTLAEIIELYTFTPEKQGKFPFS